MPVRTTVSIKKETRNGLQQIGRKGQTFDQIISELLKKWDERC